VSEEESEVYKTAYRWRDMTVCARIAATLLRHQHVSAHRKRAQNRAGRAGRAEDAGYASYQDMLDRHPVDDHDQPKAPPPAPESRSHHGRPMTWKFKDEDMPTQNGYYVVWHLELGRRSGALDY
jgi:hypothetical protein